MWAKKVTILLAVLAFLGGGESARIPAELLHQDPGLRIINGEDAQPHQLPGMVFLASSGNRLLCGGSLISAQYVLTAAHCLDGKSQVTVHTGLHNKQKTNSAEVTTISDIPSSNFIIYPRYNRANLDQDLALIKLPTSVPESQYVKYVSLPPSQADTYDNRGAQVFGWGYTLNGLPDILQYTNVSVYPINQCEAEYNGINSDYHLCLYDKDDNKRQCNCDSGGPVLVDGVQVGIVSFSHKPCTRHIPAVTTRITTYLQWIKNVAGL